MNNKLTKNLNKIKFGLQVTMFDSQIHKNKGANDIFKELDTTMDQNILIITNYLTNKPTLGAYCLSKWSGRSIFVHNTKAEIPFIKESLDNYNKSLNIKDKWNEHLTYPHDTGRFFSDKYIITTLDQVLQGWIGIGTQSFIRGKNILLSNFVFNDIQMFYSDKSFMTFINFLDSIKNRTNRFVILTQVMPQYLIDFFSKRYNLKVLKDKNPLAENRSLSVDLINKIDLKKVNSLTQKQIIICNSQKQQELIYNGIDDKNRCIILNNYFLKTDKKVIEKNLKYFTQNSPQNNKILVTTSLIEDKYYLSAPYVYSFSCPIDKLILRSNICTSKDDISHFIIINDSFTNEIYDRLLVNNTMDYIEKKPGLHFSQSEQLNSCSDILNKYYKEKLIEKNIRLNNYKLKYGNVFDLINDIGTCNLIIDNNISLKSTPDTFNRESIGISMKLLSKLSSTNKLYVLKKGEIIITPFSSNLTSSVIVIKGTNCTYDLFGFRYTKEGSADTFKYFNNNRKLKINDYKNEPWINHALVTGSLVKKQLLEDNYSDYIADNIENIYKVACLHDIGILDEVWQGSSMADSKDIPLGHFPFKPVEPNLISRRGHKFIGGIILKSFFDKILFNVIIQHHGRINSYGHDIIVDKYKLTPYYELCLKEVGFVEDIAAEGESCIIDYKNDILSPKDDEWNDFLYIVGTLMEKGAEAISLF